MEEPGSKVKVSRLRELDDKQSISPFVRAAKLEAASLYWLGVNTWPPMFRNRQWICAFFDRFIVQAEKQWQVVPLQFLKMSVAGNLLNDPFIRNARTTVPIIGALTRPDRTPAGLPSAETIEQASKKKITLDPNSYADDFTYWFTRGNDAEQRALFQAYGGMSILLAEPDEQARVAIPEVPKYIMDHPSMARFKSIDIKAENRVVEALGGKFGPLTKELFGEPFKSQTIYEGLLFVLPQWTSASFFDAKPEELQKLFKLCKVYIQESPEDQGILIACEDNLDDMLIEIVEELKSRDRMEYTS